MFRDILQIQQSEKTKSTKTIVENKKIRPILNRVERTVQIRPKIHCKILKTERDIAEMPFFFDFIKKTYI